MRKLFSAAAAVALSSSFALADSLNTASAIAPLRGIYALPATMPITNLRSWSFGGLANLAFPVVLLRQGANFSATTTTLNNPDNSHVSVTGTTIQNSSALPGLHY